jgi:hypothetical protein
VTAAQRFARARPRLLRLAYSVLGDLCCSPARTAIAVLSIQVDGGRIARIDVVRNPEKLRRVGSPGRL